MQSEVISDAMKTIINLLDEKSFVEIGEHVKSGVICGYGTIKFRPVCIFAQDSSVNSGAMTEKNCEKICNVINMAEKNGIPIIAIYDSIGTDISESTGVLLGLKKVLTKLSGISGIVPIISIVLGNAVGISSFSVNFSDFIFMIDKKSKMFVNGPQNITTVTGKEISSENLGGAKVHAEKTGICDVYTNSEEECIEKVKEILEYLPENNLSDTQIIDSDDINRNCDELNSGYNNIEEVISSVADNGKFFELKKEFGRNIITGFGRIGGRAVGIVANRENKLNIVAINKVRKFIRCCDSFNIPIVTLTNCEGTEVSIEEENLGISSSLSSLIYAYSDATIPKINIIVGNMFGGAGAVMGICADVNLAWKNSKISAALPKTAVNILYSEEIANSEEPIKYRDEKLNEYLENEIIPEKAQDTMFIDGIIEPIDTRKRIISSLELYTSKREIKIPKKHGNMPI